MPLFSDTDIQAFADLASDLALIDDCAIERNFIQNGQITSTAIETVKCLAKPITSQFATFEDWQGNAMTWRVSLPLGTNVKEGDYLTIKGQKMEVQKVLTPKSYAVLDEVEASGVKS